MGDAPRRIQLRRIKGWCMPAGAISVSRPSIWGNPWKVEHIQGVGWCVTNTRTNIITPEDGPTEAHALAVSRFRADLVNQPDLVEEARGKLRGHDLGCWCPIGMPCHADVWIEIANA
ncbi:DUF4326 domain-containing protein [Roseomonas sp. HJA6]|uniref:DUF4326 domain-containing protein n=1 Tax=Roseomonas alba TaxID=2846776 RepID=A0ABS7ACX9_9PROT|nr:DUF4326 domain-containing protein [Neoroseomonas alba]MBW6400028.1 DUF4326 domain-containing protein [Neoroseomonas alba]